MRRIGLFAVFLVFPPFAGATDQQTITLSSGRTIATPSIEEMSCVQLSDKLSEIDETGYRGTRPEPRATADLPLLRYEEEVAAAFYRDCVMRALGERNPSTAFAKGYRRVN